MSLKELQKCQTVTKGVGFSDRVDPAGPVRQPQGWWIPNEVQAPAPQRQANPPVRGTKGSDGDLEKKDGVLPVSQFLKESEKQSASEILREQKNRVLVKSIGPWKPIQTIRLSWGHILYL